MQTDTRLTQCVSLSGGLKWLVNRLINVCVGRGDVPMAVTCGSNVLLEHLAPTSPLWYRGAFEAGSIQLQMTSSDDVGVVNIKTPHGISHPHAFVFALGLA